MMRKKKKLYEVYVRSGVWDVFEVEAHSKKEAIEIVTSGSQDCWQTCSVGPGDVPRRRGNQPSAEEVVCTRD